MCYYNSSTAAPKWVFSLSFEEKAQRPTSLLVRDEHDAPHLFMSSTKSVRNPSGSDPAAAKRNA